MRNKGDKPVSSAAIRRHQRRFRVLADWDISYAEEVPLPGRLCMNGQCYWDRKHKIARIYPCPAKVAVDRYMRHEILHIALAAVGRSRELNELLVQDLCRMLEER